MLMLYSAVLAMWRPWAPTVTGRGIDSGLHMAEQVPLEPAASLRAFLTRGPARPVHCRRRDGSAGHLGGMCSCSFSTRSISSSNVRR